MCECMCERKYEMKDCKEPNVCMQVSNFYIGVRCVCERERVKVFLREISPWYDCTGWRGIKHKLTLTEITCSTVFSKCFFFTLTVEAVLRGTTKSKKKCQTLPPNTSANQHFLSLFDNDMLRTSADIQTWPQIPQKIEPSKRCAQNKTWLLQSQLFNTTTAHATKSASEQ